jgi:ubiquinone/menaquinone biosynthesis C-methylase UbiE
MSSKNDINELQHFNQWSNTYEQSIMQWLLFDRVHKGVLARIPSEFVPSEILDIGCGTGRLLRRMKKRWPSAHLLGVDLAEGMVIQARQQTPDAKIYHASAEQLPLQDNTLDLITSTVSFHHWNDQAQGIREVARVLRPGGLFILADMTLPAHGHPTSRSKVRSMFQLSGLSIIVQESPLLFFSFTTGQKS